MAVALEDAGGEAEEGRLSATGRPGEEDELAGGDGEVDGADGGAARVAVGRGGEGDHASTRRNDAAKPVATRQATTV